MATSAPSDRIDAHFRKKRLLDKEARPAASAKLWGFALEAVLDQIADEAPEQLVRMIERNGKLRKLMVDEIVRKPHPSLQLGDTDIIEVFRVKDLNDETAGSASHPGHVEDWCVAVGDLPRRLRTALKHEFDMHASAIDRDARTGWPDHAEFFKSPDGRICFECTTKKALQLTTWVEEAYLAELNGTIDQEDLPDPIICPYTYWEDVDLADEFPFLIKETQLWDAYDLNLNNKGEWRIRRLVRQEFFNAFCMPYVLDCDKEENEVRHTRQSIPVGASWVRKPKMRVWVSVM